MSFNYSYKHILPLFVLFLLTPFFSFAASLNISPSTVNKNIGERFSVNVTASSTDQALNAVSGKLNFSPEYLEVVSVSRTNSVIDFWSQEPSYTNSGGSLSFEGVVFNGYLGSGANIATVTFRPKKVGSTTMSLVSGDILANDGIGTSILSSLGKAQLTISAASVPGPEVSTTEPELVPASDTIPDIQSPTHPDQKLWYTNTDPVFTWYLPDEVVDVDFVISDSPDPEYERGVSRGRISQVNSFSQKDGTHYLHAIFKTEKGWGPSVAYRFNIDTKAPESFFIQEVYRSINGQQASFLFEAEDSASGISHYKIDIDHELQETWSGEGGDVYTTPQLSSGIHTMYVSVVDMAGNTRTEEFIFRISPDAGGLYLNDYLVMGAIVILLILIILLFMRYGSLLRAYRGLTGVAEKKDTMVTQKRLQSKMQTIEKAQKELHNLEAKIREELDSLK